MLVQRRRSTVDYQRWYNVGKQLAQPYSDCGTINFPTMDVQGLSSVYSALVVDCKIPTFIQRWVYNRPTRREMDVQPWDSHLICSIVLSRCSTVISKILISAYFNILDITPEYLDITTKHIRWLSHT